MRQRAEGIIKKVMDALGSFYTVNYRHVHLPTFVNSVIMFEKNENKRKISRGWLAGVACFENLARRKSHYFKMQNELLVRQTFHGFDPKVCVATLVWNDQHCVSIQWSLDWPLLFSS